MVQGTTTTEGYSGVYPERSRGNAVGNRLSSLGVSPYNYNTSNELTSTPSGSYTYDYNGNTLTDASGRSYTWDFENRLTQVTLPGTGGTATFKYDPFGRRIEKVFTQNSTTTTTNYLYDGDNAIETVDQNGAVLAKFAQGQNIDEPLAESVSGATYDYEQDGLGSATSLTNSSGALSLSYTYDSFGKITASSGSVSNPFRYTGRDFDTETSLYYYRARYYDPATGRFLSEDPSGFSDGLNFYRYVWNDPSSYSDPSGLTTYKNFLAPDQVRMQHAVQQVLDKLNSNCPSCAGPDADKLRNALQTATFVYRRKLAGKECGRVGPIDYLKHQAEISPDAFGPGCCYQGPSDDALASTILHETFHLTHILPHENRAYKLEKNCFGCQRPPK